MDISAKKWYTIYYFLWIDYLIRKKLCLEIVVLKSETSYERIFIYYNISNLFDSATGHTYTLNSTGTFILRKLIEDISLEQIIAQIREEYDTTEEELSRDLNQFLNFLTKLGIVEEVTEEGRNGKKTDQHRSQRA